MDHIAARSRSPISGAVLLQPPPLHVPTLRHVRTARQLLQHHMAGQLLLQLQHHEAHHPSHGQVHLLQLQLQ